MGGEIGFSILNAEIMDDAHHIHEISFRNK